MSIKYINIWATLPVRRRFAPLDWRTTVAAASKILGPLGFLCIMAAAYRATPSTTRTPTPRSPEKKRATLVAKTALTPSTWRLDFQLDEPIRFVPGQYVSLRVAPLTASW